VGVTQPLIDGKGRKLYIAFGITNVYLLWASTVHQARAEAKRTWGRVKVRRAKPEDVERLEQMGAKFNRAVKA
jgi:hypothetical protein